MSIVESFAKAHANIARIEENVWPAHSGNTSTVSGSISVGTKYFDIAAVVYHTLGHTDPGASAKPIHRRVTAPWNASAMGF